ncbi:unnamed protein product [Albugo candida]|uniref:Tetraspanin n=1 Tax=Albugo candida TaxID=65357 RepID=A0A024GLZ3_9STRA|nr:unnamed protein product [Albugo candida]|eukprot:CCI47535.1 unnamed protein product [Albugo candida]
MASADDEKNDSISVNIAKVILMLLNMAIVVIGSLIVHFSHRIKASGWLDALSEEYDWITRTTFMVLLAFGITLIVIGTVGCAGAWLQRRWILTIYGFLLILALVFFVLIGVVSGVIKLKYTKINQNKSDQVSDPEIGNKFNELYCYGQIPYYCQDAKIVDALDTFNLSSFASSVSKTATNISSLCDFDGISLTNQMEQMCTVCRMARQNQHFRPVFDWFERECPRTSLKMQWCYNFLQRENVGDEIDKRENAPFRQCRDRLYHFISSWSSGILIASIIVCFLILSVLASACLIRRKTSKDIWDEFSGQSKGYPEEVNGSYNQIRPPTNPKSVCF